MSRKSQDRKKRNIRLTSIILVIPLLGGVLAVMFVFSSHYKQRLGAIGTKRLETQNWEMADKEFTQNLPANDRRYAYYEVKENENVAKVAERFSVPEATLAALNPGTIVAGTIIKVPPLQAPLPEAASNGKLSGARVVVDEGIVKVRNDYKFDKIVTNIPELMKFLASYSVIEQTGPKTYRINRPISIEENIRLDITGATVEKLELKSGTMADLTCLCIANAEMLIKDTIVTTYDPATGQPDYMFDDSRSFVRALKSSRMDIINSTMTYLGGALQKGTTHPLLRAGGTYGISWRISDTRLGRDIVTGWVENDLFYKNHFGSYSFGASGMVWRGNHYLENDVYGLDPHDDSNNALVENNIFERNGKHGFIVSKRCNYNVIRNNISFGNKLHGFMLHQDSAYNVIENNIAYDNVDNYAVFDSDFNIIRNNKSYNAKSNHIRVNKGARNTYIMNNELAGGRRGVYLYGDVVNTYISGNIIQDVFDVFATSGATNALFANNAIDGLHYKFGANDREVFGPNTVTISPISPPEGVSEVKKFKTTEVINDDESD